MLTESLPQVYFKPWTFRANKILMNFQETRLKFRPIVLITSGGEMLQNRTTTESPAPSEISVGTPSPPPRMSPVDDRLCQDVKEGLGKHKSKQEEYFKPLKKLKMMDLQEKGSEDEDEEETKVQTVTKSFSIENILSSKSSDSGSKNVGQQVKIVRPWDLDELTPAAASHTSDLERLQQHFIKNTNKQYELNLAAKAYQQQFLPQQQLVPQFVPRLNPFEIQQQMLLQQQYQLLRLNQQYAASSLDFPVIPGLSGLNFANFGMQGQLNSETGSDRSSSVNSNECCSPDLQGQKKKDDAKGEPKAGAGQAQDQKGTPLDALFQMTSKTFDENAAENSQGWWIYKCSSIHTDIDCHETYTL